jgi:glycine/D-amino acid oxidase-like deaminating enzyme
VGVPDVAVIGGGIVGTATASFLAAAGARVTLYELAGIAAGASGRNSGVVQQPLDAELASLHQETLACFRELGAAVDGGFALPPEPAGLLYVGHDGAAVRAEAEAIRAAQPRLEPEVVDGQALRALEPALAPGLFACRISTGYPIAPAAATRAFAGRARSLGARIVTGSSVEITIDGDRAIGVRAAGITEPAGSVVVAAGPWTPALVDPTGAWRPIRRSWGVVVSVGLVAPPRHVLERAGIGTEPGVAGSTDDEAGDAGVEFSLVTADGSSSVGSTFVETEPEPTAWAPAILRSGARFVPAIGSAPVLGYRSCARPLSGDGRPLVGPVPWLRNAYVAAGHGPWGISTGPASARQIADAVLGRAVTIPPVFDPGRFGGR